MDFNNKLAYTRSNQIILILFQTRAEDLSGHKSGRILWSPSENYQNLFSKQMHIFIVHCYDRIVILKVIYLLRLPGLSD